MYIKKYIALLRVKYKISIIKKVTFSKRETITTSLSHEKKLNKCEQYYDKREVFSHIRSMRLKSTVYS